MTWKRATPLLVVCGIFDALRFMFEWFVFFGPALATVWCTTKLGGTLTSYSAGILGEKAAASLCGSSATVVAFVGAPAFEVFGLIMAMAVGFAGWLVIGGWITIRNRRIFRELSSSNLWFLSGLLISEIPFLGSFPALTTTTWRMYSAQIKQDAENFKKYEASQAAADAARDREQQEALNQEWSGRMAQQEDQPADEAGRTQTGQQEEGSEEENNQQEPTTRIPLAPESWHAQPRPAAAQPQSFSPRAPLPRDPSTPPVPLVEASSTPEPEITGSSRSSSIPSVQNQEYGVRRHLLTSDKPLTNPQQISLSLVDEARVVRDEILQRQGAFRMSKEEFRQNFPSKEDGEFGILDELKQQNVGDCYAVAAIHALSRSPHFEMIVRTSMEKGADGSWEVSLPLMSEDRKVYKITQEEIEPQKNPQFLRRAKGDLVPDLRTKLHPPEAKEGLRVLEAAYLKQKFGGVDRLAADEGGHADEVLLNLGGENFKKFNLSSTAYNERRKKWEFHHGLNSLEEGSLDKDLLDDFLENFDPEIDIATVGTKHFDYSTLEGIVANTFDTYKTPGAAKFFVPGHAYSVSSVNPEQKLITLANPWDTTKPIRLTYDQFKDTFQSIRAIRVDSAKLIKNMDLRKIPIEKTPQ